MSTMSSNFLLITSVSSISATMVSLLLTALVLNLDLLPDLMRADSQPPVFHCTIKFKQASSGCHMYSNGSILDESDCIYKCSDNLCSDVIRLCQEGERPTDMFFHSVLPILVLVLLSEFGIALLLQKIGDYDAMFTVSKMFFQPIVHWALINDWLSINLHNELKGELQDASFQTLDSLMLAVKKSTLRQQDPVSGNTCLHFAFLKCCFKEVRVMISRGANPLQLNSEGWSIDEILKRLDPEKIRDHREHRGTDIFVRRVTSRYGREFKIKINVVSCNDNGQLKGKIVFQDQNSGLELFNEPLSSPDMLVLSLCLMTETAEMIERCDSKSFTFQEIQSSLRQLAQLMFSTKNRKALNDLKDFCTESVIKSRKAEVGLNWTCTNILHKLVNKGSNLSLIKAAIALGVNPEAKNCAEATAFEMKVRNIGRFKDADDLKDQVLWYALKHGAAKYAVCDQEKDRILELIRLKCFESERQKQVPENSKPIFFHAVAKNDVKSVESFLSCSGFGGNDLDDNRRSPLHIAAIMGSLSSMKILISAGSDVDAKDLYKIAPIHFAAKHGHLECLECLINSGADVNSRGQFKQTPLHLAAKHGHLDCVEFLLKSGADIKAADSHRQTPLHSAAWNCNLAIMMVLLDNGAKINVADVRMSTPLHYVASKGSLECVQFLLTRGPNVFATDRQGQDPLDVCPEADHECREAIEAKQKKRLSNRMKKQSSKEKQKSLESKDPPA